MTGIVPFADIVVAIPQKQKDKTPSGLYVPEEAQKKPQVAIVLAVGVDVKNVKVGDSIIYKQFEFSEVTYQDRKYILVQEENVLAKIENEEPGDESNV